MDPVQDPVTGEEKQDDLTQPIQALAQFYRAFNSRDLSLMEENWDPSEEAAMDNPLGGIKRSWTEIRPVYEKLFDGPARVYVEFYDYTLHQAGDVFYAVGRERGWFEKGEARLKLKIRTSRVFKRVGKKWRQVHHHGSIEDPELLKKYQALVLGKSQGI